MANPFDLSRRGDDTVVVTFDDDGTIDLVALDKAYPGFGQKFLDALDASPTGGIKTVVDPIHEKGLD
ncbi:hypothetical protein [Parasynechococcus sp.]|uniref:hypothetical protein n=1 Tax=Parasynechococcus sp. TaxID=3101203 RepID=UPI0037038021